MTPDNAVHAMLSAHLKCWAFDVHFGSHSVTVYNRKNISYVKMLVSKALGGFAECYSVWYDDSYEERRLKCLRYA